MGEYLQEHREVIIASLVVGVIFGVILPVLLGKARDVLATVFDFAGNRLSVIFGRLVYCLVMMCMQIGFEVFLLQQWIFTWNALNYPGGAYDQYAYLPLTVVIPVFVLNFFLFVVMAFRLEHLE